MSHVFLFIGADPNTEWLGQCDVKLDGKGFVCTSEAHPLETDHRGVFVIGVRPRRLGQKARRRGGWARAPRWVSALHAYLADGGPIATEKV